MSARKWRFENRTLQEVVYELPDDIRIYIGAKRGNGFFFIGTKADYESDIDYLSGYRLDRAQINLEENAHDLQILIANGVPEKRIEEDQDQYCQELSDYGKLLARLANRTAFLRNYVENYIPYRKRAAVEMYRKYVDPDELGMIVLIDGTEGGDYWTYNEYVKGMKKKREKVS